MQGGMVSAITAEAASSATAFPILPAAACCGDQHRATAATSAIWSRRCPRTDLDVTITTFSPPAHRPTARCAIRSGDRHAVGFHQIADQDEERNRQQHEKIVDAARHLRAKMTPGKVPSTQMKINAASAQRKADRASRCSVMRSRSASARPRTAPTRREKPPTPDKARRSNAVGPGPR